MSREERLANLTRRWQLRRAERRRRRSATGQGREMADPERMERARRAFPFREMTPAEYVARHGAEMAGYTYDDYAYPDPELQAWLDEVGRLLRSGPMEPAP